jgi:1,4-dihydroxy-2-naphthoyl-CoA synthase
MNKITLRAITAFSRTDLKTSEGSLSIRAREINYLGKQYVALESESSSELLALYRCMNRGELKRLKRWPAELLAKKPVTQSMGAAAAEKKAPAILELSPLKAPAKVNKAKKPAERASAANVNQTDMFES